MGDLDVAPIGLSLDDPGHEIEAIAGLGGHRHELVAVDFLLDLVAPQAEAGGQPLPWPARLAMRLAARVMTKTAFWI